MTLEEKFNKLLFKSNKQTEKFEEALEKMAELEWELKEKSEEMNKYVNREHEKQDQKVEKRDVKVNTVVDFSNVPFTTIAEKLFEAKIQKKTWKIYTIM